MEPTELEDLLRQLRRFGTDHQQVEAKRAQGQLPDDVWTSLSAFANGEGGLLLLGVHEEQNFAVTGVEDPERMTGDLQALADQMEPHLRLVINLVEHPDGIVVATHVPAISRRERPCHLRRKGPFGGSFIRVGDGDQQLSETEVDELLTTQQRSDHSARPAPQHARLNPDLTDQFCRRVRETSSRAVGTSDKQLLRRWRAVTKDREPSLAGVLALGDAPESVTPLARLTYRVQLGESGPSDVRHSGDHIEGTVGEILDGVMSQLRGDLRVDQVETNGAVVDDTDVPLLALREVVSNALIHRSLSPHMDSRSALVEVHPHVVRVVSPGGLYPSVDPERVGLGALAADLRNVALARICEKLSTPSGDRIVESQGEGIPAADRASRKRGTAPPLFVDHPAQLEVLLLRGGLDETAASRLLEDVGYSAEAEDVRIVAWALRYRDLEHELDPQQRRAAELDVHMAARLSPFEPNERAASRVSNLESEGVLQRAGGVQRSKWIIDPNVREGRGDGTDTKKDRIPDLLEAIDEQGGEATREQIGARLGYSSNKSTSTWINRGIERNLVEPTKPRFHPERAYRLTRTGEAVLSRERGRSS